MDPRNTSISDTSSKANGCKNQPVEGKESPKNSPKPSKPEFNMRINPMNGSYYDDSSEEEYQMDYESTDTYDEDSFNDPESLRSMADPNPRVVVRRRKKYTIEFREDVVAYSEKHTIKDTSEKFNINTAMVAMWRKNVCGRKAKYMAIEREVLKFFKECQVNGSEITRTMIKEKAKDVYNSLKFSQNNGPKKREFVASDSWVHRFLTRNKLSIPGDALKKVASKPRRSSGKTNSLLPKSKDCDTIINDIAPSESFENSTNGESEHSHFKNENTVTIIQ